MKKDRKLLESLKKDFINGAVANGENKEHLEEFWEKLLGFSEYSFNASHSISYAYLSYYTAWLKCNHPVEFYAACISCETDPTAQSEYVNDAKSHNIEILPPQINESDLDFSVYDGKILYGLKGLKGVGDKTIADIIQNRPYSSVSDFLIKTITKKMKVSKTILEALIKIGAFDPFGYSRRSILDSYDRFLTDYKTDIKLKKDISLIKYNDPCYFNDNSNFTLFDILTYEKKYMGTYLSGNPFEIIKNVIRDTSIVSYLEITQSQGGSVFAEVISVKEVKTKAAGKKMSILKCIDSSNSIFDIALFPAMYEKYSKICFEGAFLIFSLKNSDKGPLLVSASSVTESLRAYTENQKSENLVNFASIRIKSLNSMKKIENRKSSILNSDTNIALKPCKIYFDSLNYLFYLGELLFPLNNIGIRLLNSIEDIEVVINR